MSYLKKCGTTMADFLLSKYASWEMQRGIVAIVFYLIIIGSTACNDNELPCGRSIDYKYNSGWRHEMGFVADLKERQAHIYLRELRRQGSSKQLLLTSDEVDAIESKLCLLVGNQFDPKYTDSSEDSPSYTLKIDTLSLVVYGTHEPLILKRFAAYLNSFIDERIK